MSHTIPKREVQARVHLRSGEPLEGQLFLDFIDVIHRGEQSLLDKLNDDYHWMPIRIADGTTEIVNRSLVTLVEPVGELPVELVRKEGSGVFREESVRVTLITGDVFDGRIAMDLPDEFSRVSDFLNFPQSFFALETAKGPILVAKEHVAHLQALEAPPTVPDARGIEERA